MFILLLLLAMSMVRGSPSGRWGASIACMLFSAFREDTSNKSPSQDSNSGVGLKIFVNTYHFNQHEKWCGSCGKICKRNHEFFPQDGQGRLLSPLKKVLLRWQVWWIHHTTTRLSIEAMLSFWDGGLSGLSCDFTEKSMFILHVQSNAFRKIDVWRKVVVG